MGTPKPLVLPLIIRTCWMLLGVPPYFRKAPYLGQPWLDMNWYFNILLSMIKLSLFTSEKIVLW